MSMEIREPSASPVRASPAGALASLVFVPALFAAIVFLFTAVSLAGPPDVVRSFILVGYLLAGVALCRALFRLTDRAGWHRRPWLQSLAVATAGAVAVGLALFAIQSILNAELRWETLPWMLALAFGLSCSGCALATARRLSPPPATTTVTREQQARAGAPRFMARLPQHLRSSELLAIQAEDHYLRVYTSHGETLLLLRLSDALAEVSDLDGAQTHRSWWVARTAIAKVLREGRQATLILKTGSRAPVSRTHLKTLTSQNWL